jgi:hypothetical protein
MPLSAAHREKKDKEREVTYLNMLEDWGWWSHFERQKQRVVFFNNAYWLCHRLINHLHGLEKGFCSLRKSVTDNWNIFKYNYNVKKRHSAIIDHEKNNIQKSKHE